MSGTLVNTGLADPSLFYIIHFYCSTGEADFSSMDYPVIYSDSNNVLAMEILRPEINHLTQQDVPEEYEVDRTRVQQSPFYADGFRANLHELMYKGNYSLYSMANIAEAVMLMGANQQQVSFETEAKTVVFSGVKFKKMSTTSAYMEFPNIVGDNQFSYIRRVTVVSGGSSTEITGVNNSMFIGSFTSADFNDASTVDVRVELSNTSPIGMIGDVTVDTGDRDLNTAMAKWLDESLPISVQLKYVEPMFSINGSIRFSSARQSIQLGYVSSGDFDIWASSNDVRINGQNGMTRQRLNNGDVIVIEDLVGRTVDAVVTVSVSGTLFQFQTSWQSNTPSWTLRDTEIVEHQRDIQFTVTSDEPWQINIACSTEDQFVYATPSSGDGVDGVYSCRLTFDGAAAGRNAVVTLVDRFGDVYESVTLKQTEPTSITGGGEYHLSANATARDSMGYSLSRGVVGGWFRVDDNTGDTWEVIGVFSKTYRAYQQTGRLWVPYILPEGYDSVTNSIRVTTDSDDIAERQLAGEVTNINSLAWSFDDGCWYRRFETPIPIQSHVDYRWSGGLQDICNAKVQDNRLKFEWDQYTAHNDQMSDAFIVLRHYHYNTPNERYYEALPCSRVQKTLTPSEYSDQLYQRDVVEKWWDTSTND